VPAFARPRALACAWQDSAVWDAASGASEQVRFLAGRHFLHAENGNAVASLKSGIEPRLKILGKEITMLYYALVFLLIALFAGVLGFGGIAFAAAGIAKIFFVVFLVLFVLGMAAHVSRRGVWTDYALRDCRASGMGEEAIVMERVASEPLWPSLDPRQSVDIRDGAAHHRGPWE
jgi:uncharacterized membrane protein YtjA (UPF0391 family)